MAGGCDNVLVEPSTDSFVSLRNLKILGGIVVAYIHHSANNWLLYQVGLVFDEKR